MRDEIGNIRAQGAELVIVGSGALNFAAAFREDFDLDCPLLVDPELHAYRAAGLRRGRVELLSPRVPIDALRALGAGSRQTGVEGDPWQLGAVCVIHRGGDLTYQYVSREAGDRAPVEEILAALEEDAETIPESSATPRAQVWIGKTLSRLVDPFILSSFDRTGFRIRQSSQRASNAVAKLGGS